MLNYYYYYYYFIFLYLIFNTGCISCIMSLLSGWRWARSTSFPTRRNTARRCGSWRRPAATGSASTCMAVTRVPSWTQWLALPLSGSTHGVKVTVVLLLFVAGSKVCDSMVEGLLVVWCVFGSIFVCCRERGVWLNRRGSSSGVMCFWIDFCLLQGARCVTQW